ncbi:1570_t:CDS:2 [Paraglomus brasilianum]|uniref:1570_t:CDS:1 n=1 Tax=Paraglomus brasilianum TaxID=144538 RepID=A0A9N9FN35_9GLOM|nr:1570_t:CDS:2 [Paraglomus brasilianum]
MDPQPTEPYSSIRISHSGKINSYVSHGLESLKRTESTRSYITLIGEGKGVTKTISVAEIIKRKVERIYQYNEIGNVDEDGVGTKSGMYMKIYLSLMPVKELEMALGIINNATRRHSGLDWNSTVTIIQLCWVCAIVFGEVLVFHMAAWNCGWPEISEWNTNTAKPFHMTIITDPQLIDENSYNRARVMTRLTEFYSDNYMRKNWKNLLHYFDSDAIMILGDLLDSGRELDDKRWSEEHIRFNNLFQMAGKSRVPVYYAVGNHDIGIGDTIVPAANKRFRDVYGKVNYELSLGNHTIVVLDTLSFGASDEISKEAREFVKGFENRTDHTHSPRILMTHVPLFRGLATADCGPFRQRGNMIPYMYGYQYQTMMYPEPTETILDSIKPVLTISGDDHDFCEIYHEKGGSNGEGSFEVTVPTYSFTMGVRKPGFLLLSLYNPTNSSSSATFTYRLCFLPDQLQIFIFYGFLLSFTIITFLACAYYDMRTQTALPPLSKDIVANRIITSSSYWHLVRSGILRVGAYAISTYIFCLILFPIAI